MAFQAIVLGKTNKCLQVIAAEPRYIEVKLIPDAWPFDLVTVDEAGSGHLVYDYLVEKALVTAIKARSLELSSGISIPSSILTHKLTQGSWLNSTVLLYKDLSGRPLLAVDCHFPRVTDSGLVRVPRHQVVQDNCFARFASARVTGGLWHAVTLGLVEGYLRKSVSPVTFDTFIQTIADSGHPARHLKTGRHLSKLRTVKHTSRNTAVSRCSKYLESMEFILNLVQELQYISKTCLDFISEKLSVGIWVYSMNGEVITQAASQSHLFQIYIVHKQEYYLMYTHEQNVLDHFNLEKMQFADAKWNSLCSGAGFALDVAETLGSFADWPEIQRQISCNAQTRIGPDFRTRSRQVRAKMPVLRSCQVCYTNASWLTLECGHSLCFQDLQRYLPTQVSEVFRSSLACPLCKVVLSPSSKLRVLFPNLPKYLEAVQRPVESTFLENQELVCCMCRTKIEEELAKLECQHQICTNCLLLIFPEFRDQKCPAFCPDCHLPIPPERIHQAIQGNRCYHPGCKYSMCHPEERPATVVVLQCKHCGIPLLFGQQRVCGCFLCDLCMSSIFAENNGICYECTFRFAAVSVSVSVDEGCKICGQSATCLGLACEHTFCVDCLVQHCSDSLNKSQLKLRCPSCTTVIQQATLTRFLPPVLIEKYERMQALHDPTLISCPCCGGHCKIQTRKVWCDLCETEFCSWCFQEFHLGQCKLDTRLIEELRTQETVFTCCPHCRTVATYCRESGRVICPVLNCKTAYCACCRARWAPIHAHGPSYHRSSCKFWLKTIDPVDFIETCIECVKRQALCVQPRELFYDVVILAEEF